MDKNKSEGKKLTWADLGVPQGMVEELEAAGRAGVKLEDPPDYMVERAVDAVMEVVKERRVKDEAERKIRQEALMNERISRSSLWRLWYWLQRIFKR